LISFKRRGIRTIYNDLQIEEIKSARQKLDRCSGPSTEFNIGNFLEIAVPNDLDFIFSTGLLHTLDTSAQIAMVSRMMEKSRAVFILIPDVSDPFFEEDNSRNAPGQVGSMKFDTIDVSRMLSEKFTYIIQGKIEGHNLGVHHSFIYFFGGPVNSNLEYSKWFQIKFKLLDSLPIQPK
jgi:hypothetical protein